MNHATLPIVPKTVPELLSPQWLTFALQRCFPGVEVATVEVVHSFRTMAVKTRIRVTYSRGGDGVPTAFFIKGFFESDALAAAGQACSIMEANFYDQVAPIMYWWIESTPNFKDSKTAPTNHSPFFTIDETVMKTGVRSEVMVALTYLKAHPVK